MNIVLEYHHPTKEHCHVNVFINGTLTGDLILRQEELVSFYQIICHGCHPRIDFLLGRGNSIPPPEEDIIDRMGQD
jgi:hypothetical protein